MPIAVRPATADDQHEIVALVRSDRLKPTGLSWSNFVVALDSTGLVGAAQIRKHRDGSLELGSLVVARRLARHGRGGAHHRTCFWPAEPRVHLCHHRTGSARRPSARWGFQPIKPRQAPAVIRLNYYLGYFGGGMISWLHRPAREPPRHPAAPAPARRRSRATRQPKTVSPWARMLQMQAAQWSLLTERAWLLVTAQL